MDNLPLSVWDTHHLPFAQWNANNPPPTNAHEFIPPRPLRLPLPHNTTNWWLTPRQRNKLQHILNGNIYILYYCPHCNEDTDPNNPRCPNDHMMPLGDQWPTETLDKKWSPSTRPPPIRPGRLLKPYAHIHWTRPTHDALNVCNNCYTYNDSYSHECCYPF
jgi:hypothetical protein